MKPVMVSVVIPVFNGGGTVGAAIESVRRQTYGDHEIIIVDDGSTDETPSVVAAFGDGVRYVRQENKGVSAARNVGLAEARGEYVAFLDADDLWLRRKLEKQVAVLWSEPAVVAVQCSAYLVDDHLRVIEARRCSPTEDTCLDFLLFRNIPSFGSSVLVRKAPIQVLGGFATDLCAIEDWDMVCRLACHGRVKSIPDFLVLYRQHAKNRSRNVDTHVEAGSRILGRFFSDPTLDPALRREESRIWARFYAMLAGGYFRYGEWKQAFCWAWRAMRTSSRVGPYLAGMPIRRLKRARFLWRTISFADELPFAVGSARH